MKTIHQPSTGSRFPYCRAYPSTRRSKGSIGYSQNSQWKYFGWNAQSNQNIKLALFRSSVFERGRSFALIITEGNMLQSGVAWITQADYKGRSIQLRSVQQHDGSWKCDYKILEIEPTRPQSVKGNDGGGFPTHEEAEAVALDAAQDEIDSRRPILQTK